MFRFSKFALALAAFVALGLASAATAEAVPVVITDRATYETNNPSRTDINFGTASVPYAPSLTFSSVTFAGQNGHSVGVIAAGGAGNYALTTTGPIIFNQDYMQITLPTGTTAVAFDIMCGSGTQAGACTGAYEVYINGQLMPALTTSPDSFTFFGASDAAGITSILIRSKSTSAGPPVLDNFSFSPASAPDPVPEPATMVLFGTGLAGVASFARKRRLRARKTDEDVAVG